MCVPAGSTGGRQGGVADAGSAPQKGGDTGHTNIFFKSFPLIFILGGDREISAKNLSSNKKYLGIINTFSV